MKKIVSFFLCIVLILSFSVSAFAAESGGLICPTCGSAILVHSDTIEGIYHNIEYVCSNKECDYKRKEKKILGMESVSGATATPIEGVTAPPAGYTDKGVPSVSPSGYLYVNANFSDFTKWLASGYSWDNGFASIKTDSSNTSFPETNISGGGTHSNNASSTGMNFEICYKLTAPYTGVYFIPNDIEYNCGQVSLYFKSGLIRNDMIFSVDTDHYLSVYLKKGESKFYKCSFRYRADGIPYTYSFAPSIPIACDLVSDSVNLNKQTNITINNNTWNGNIYVDNSNNLTYIYPQYTTINENNETVTNISNNPIIYNQETNKYYTYDQTTNNYYYIYYGTPPSPSPSPDPTPSPSPDVPTKPIVPDTQNLIIPKMNANSFTDEHGTWVASGSSKYSDVFDFFRAFDRSASEIWETNVSPSYLQVEIPDPENYYIDGYIMRISKFNNRYAKEWTLQGSDDGETWDDLDTQSGQNLSDMEEHKYTLNLRKAYKYYRLNMSNYASTMCSLSHFNLLGYAAKDVTFPTPDPGGSGGGSGTTPTPTPAPTPGGSGGGSGDTNNFWNIIIKDNNKTDKEHKGIFWALVSLLIAAITFVVNMLTAYKYLFPFLPDGVIAVINTCVAVLMIFVVIKFVMRVIK